MTWNLMCPDQLHNWLDFGHSLSIFLILAAFWLSSQTDLAIEDQAKNFEE